MLSQTGTVTAGVMVELGVGDTAVGIMLGIEVIVLVATAVPVERLSPTQPVIRATTTGIAYN
jgi:hypothetical protein